MLSVVVGTPRSKTAEMTQQQDKDFRNSDLLYAAHSPGDGDMDGEKEPASPGA